MASRSSRSATQRRADATSCASGESKSDPRSTATGRPHLESAAATAATSSLSRHRTATSPDRRPREATPSLTGQASGSARAWTTPPATAAANCALFLPSRCQTETGGTSKPASSNAAPEKAVPSRRRPIAAKAGTKRSLTRAQRPGLLRQDFDRTSVDPPVATAASRAAESVRPASVLRNP